MKKIFYFLLLIIIINGSCEDNSYKIEYQKGYPNRLAGNWLAYDIEISQQKFQQLFDTIQNFDLENNEQLKKFIDLINFDNFSDRYNLTSALDPNRDGFIIFDNINNKSNRVRVSYYENKFITRFAPQLDYINKTYNKIEYISVSGQLIRREKENDDILIFITGLYNYDKIIQKSLIIIAFRKTGFEDVDYQSLLN